jgi:hypothetical protein
MQKFIDFIKNMPLFIKITAGIGLVTLVAFFIINFMVSKFFIANIVLTSICITCVVMITVYKALKK